jgi:hypothetical protein
MAEWPHAVSEVLSGVRQTARPARTRPADTAGKQRGRGARIEVHDAGDHKPERRDAWSEEESGRGLASVDALTDGRRGVSEHLGVGKLVRAVCAEHGTEKVPG